MVLKICKPPRDKDSLVSLSWQCCSWMVSHWQPWHPLLSDHLTSRSYLPSAAGQAAYYQAETCGGLAVCQPLTRISNHQHFQGENPAEEVGLQFSLSGHNIHVAFTGLLQQANHPTRGDPDLHSEAVHPGPLQVGPRSIADRNLFSISFYFRFRFLCEGSKSGGDYYYHYPYYYCSCR